ncbi:D-aminoacyl-tRNA deacylase [Neochlamydia sp. S13]|nr:D-aminoacyl-tRNA deacylase [Neochlamydia sp. S13]
MHLYLANIAGKLLIISQFTLYRNYKKGRRPDLWKQASSSLAEIR